MDAMAGLYVHVPFCLRRCAYCAFVSSVYDAARADQYLDALGREFRERTASFHPTTIYIGGGTPTALSLSQLERLLEFFRPLTASVAEFSVEANPGTLTTDKAALLRAGGVTRVSLGVQTFEPDGLQVLGRAHTEKQARAAWAMLREVGFENLSLDLIAGWPGETEAVWENDLARALALGAEHLSCYSLTYEPGTPLGERQTAGAVAALGEEEERRLFDRTGEILSAAGRPRYEISNFAKPGRECRHNVNYWVGGEYLGLGAAAHSHVGGARFANEDDIDVYSRRMKAEGTAKSFEERLPPERSARECAVIWLRMMAGIDAAAFRARTGFALATLLERELPRLIRDGWLEWDDEGERLRLTPAAIPIADAVLAELVG